MLPTMKLPFLLTGMLFGTALWSAPVGTIQPADGSINTTGSTTTVSLNRSSQINWSNFSVSATEQVKVASTGGGGFASLNIVNGPRSLIFGSVQADGPFYLVNPAGITLATSGSINAPQVLLSTLTPSDANAALSGISTTWGNSSFGDVVIAGSIAASTSIVVLSESIEITPTGRAVTPGSIEMIAAAGGVTGGGTNWTASAPGGADNGLLLNTGRIEGHTVRLISHGSIANGGVITTGDKNPAKGDSVLLRAQDIVNETQGRISTRSLTFEGDPTPTVIGPVINPDDGSNPGATSSTTQIPRLSSPGTAQVVTQINPGQLSLTTLKTLQLAAPKPTAISQTPTLAVRRGATKEEPKKKSNKVRRTSFFGATK